MCSLTGVYGLEDLTTQALVKGAFSQQHRGEDGVGLAATNGSAVYCDADLGLVSERLPGFLDAARKKLEGTFLAGLVHTRYPTEGEPTAENAQPFDGQTQHGWIAYGHNGELTNFLPLQRLLMRHGTTLSRSSDSEVFLHSYASSSGSSLEKRLGNAAQQLRGAYSLVGITRDTLFALRDPYGFKPLSIAKLNGGYIISSETTAFLDIEGAEWIGDVKPGTVVTISDRGLKEYRFAEQASLRPCVFELVYFARPDSHIAGRNVHLVRAEFGKQLHFEHPCDADIVVPIEDSGRSAAEGFAEAAGLPLRRGFIRNNNIGRTFTRPLDVLRERGVNLKLSPLQEVVKGKRVVLIDDSIVRGNTAKSRVRLMHHAGAREVHLYVASPKIIGDCYYGIDFHEENLRTTTMPDDEAFMRMIGVDSLYHLSLQGMYDSIQRVPLDARAQFDYPSRDFCTGCLTKQYPVPREP
mgnify:CR=1 FL=1